MFKVAGISRLNGEYKVRFANDTTRVKVLAKGGHTEIHLLELPKEMDKPEVVAWLKTSELYHNPHFKSTIDEADEKYNGSTVVKATKAAKPAKAAVTKAANKNAPKKEVKKPAKPAKPAKPTVKQGTTTLADLRDRAAKKSVKEPVEAE